MMEALAPLDVQIVMVAPDEFIDRAPPNFIVRPYVPQIKLLPYLSAVVCHAGHNTVCEALLYGLPLVVAPIRDDQPIVARQVVEAGAAVSLRFGKFSAAEARSAVQTILSDASFRHNAQRLGTSFMRLGGQNAAANAIERALSNDVPQSNEKGGYAIH
jgi:MGT family glycosyltransferase